MVQDVSTFYRLQPHINVTSPYSELPNLDDQSEICYFIVLLDLPLALKPSDQLSYSM